MCFLTLFQKFPSLSNIKVFHYRVLSKYFDEFNLAQHFNQWPIQFKSINFLGKEIKQELDKSGTFRILSTFSNILIVFNSSINFFIYLMKDPKLAEHISGNNNLKPSFSRFYKTVICHMGKKSTNIELSPRNISLKEKLGTSSSGSNHQHYISQPSQTTYIYIQKDTYSFSCEEPLQDYGMSFQ